MVRPGIRQFPEQGRDARAFIRNHFRVLRLIAKLAKPGDHAWTGAVFAGTVKGRIADRDNSGPQAHLW